MFDFIFFFVTLLLDLSSLQLPSFLLISSTMPVVPTLPPRSGPLQWTLSSESTLAEPSHFISFIIVILFYHSNIFSTPYWFVTHLPKNSHTCTMLRRLFRVLSLLLSTYTYQITPQLLIQPSPSSWPAGMPVCTPSVFSSYYIFVSC